MLFVAIRLLFTVIRLLQRFVQDQAVLANLAGLDGATCGFAIRLRRDAGLAVAGVKFSDAATRTRSLQGIE
jgi:hypothetical protein